MAATWPHSPLTVFSSPQKYHLPHLFSVTPPILVNPGFVSPTRVLSRSSGFEESLFNCVFKLLSPNCYVTRRGSFVLKKILIFFIMNQSRWEEPSQDAKLAACVSCKGCTVYPPADLGSHPSVGIDAPESLNRKGWRPRGWDDIGVLANKATPEQYQGANFTLLCPNCAGAVTGGTNQPVLSEQVRFQTSSCEKICSSQKIFAPHRKKK